MKNNEKGIALGFTIITAIVLLLLVSFVFGTDKSSKSILTGIYIQFWGLLFLLSYFYSQKTFIFRGLIRICENFSHPKGRKMAFFYFALAFGLGTMSIIQGITEAKQKPPTELLVKNSEIFCQHRAPQVGEFSSQDSHDHSSNLLLSTSFEESKKLYPENIAPFITNSKAPLNVTSTCSNSGQYSLSVIPIEKGILKKMLPFRHDRVSSGTILSSSFNSNIPFDTSGSNSIKLTFARYSTSNPDKKDDFNCGSSLNVYYRLDKNEWKHKMAYCGQYITETTGWRDSELIFDTKNSKTIDFLFSYETLSQANNPVLYLIDDIEITGQN